jgi:hypothetical protein
VSVCASAGCDDLFHLDSLPVCHDSMNPALHDEDCDGFADIADNCPGVVNLDQADTDHDGVGDLCDPEPVKPGDRLAGFYPFVTADSIHWSLPAPWQIHDDGLYFDGFDKDDDSKLSDTYTPPPFQIQFVMVVDAVEPAVNNELAVAGNLGKPYIECNIHHSPLDEVDAFVRNLDGTASKPSPGRTNRATG